MSANCQQVHAALRERRPLEGLLADHVVGCSACEALRAGGVTLVEALDAADDTSSFDDMFAEVEQAVTAERGPVAWLRSRPTAQRILLALGGAVLVPGLVLATWQRVDLSVYPDARWAFDVLVPMAVAAVAVAAALRPLHRRAWPRWVEPVVVMLAVVAMLVAPSLLMPAHQHHPASLTGTGAELIPRAMVCLVFGTVFGLPVALWLLALARDGRGWSRPAMLAMVGSGLVGALAIFMHCPIVAPEHLLLGHAPILLPFLALGFIGRLRGAPAGNRASRLR